MDSVDSASVPPSQSEEHAADIPDAALPEINERMPTSIPLPRYNRHRRIEVNTDQNDGALQALEMHHSAVFETATSASNMAQETLLLDRSPPLEGVCFILSFLIRILVYVRTVQVVF